jgi:hypothetical protein
VASALAVIGAVWPAAAEEAELPEPGTAQWRELFAVDPHSEPLGQAPFSIGTGTKFETTLKGELAGFDVGRIFLTVELSEQGYRVDYQMEQRGVARWFSDGEATAVASGLFGEDANIVSSYYLNHDYDGEDDQQRTELYRAPREDRYRLWSLPEYELQHPVSEEVASGAVDPLAGLVAIAFTPVPKGQNPCNRRVPVLDGRRRFDLVTRPEGTEFVAKNGKDRFEGDTIKCKLVQEKVAGYREKNRGDIDGDIWIYLAEVPSALKSDTLAYVPVKIVGRTGIVGASLQAKRPKLIAADGTEVKLY